VTGVFLIILALECTGDEEPLFNLNPNILRFVLGGYSILAIFMSAAFKLLMMSIKHYKVKAAFALGMTLLGGSIFGTIGVAIFNFGTVMTKIQFS